MHNLFGMSATGCFANTLNPYIVVFSYLTTFADINPVELVTPILFGKTSPLSLF